METIGSTASNIVIPSSREGVEVTRRSRTVPSRMRMLAGALLHALPDEARSLRDSFRQARSDMREVKERARRTAAIDNPSVELDKPVRVSRLEVIRYLGFRAGMTVYQIGDDIPGLAAFMELRHSHGVVPAYLAVKTGSAALAFALGVSERKAQIKKAELIGVPTEQYDGPLLPDILEAAVTSAPWVVMGQASKEREQDVPVNILSMGRIAGLSATYGVVNTGFYAGSTSIQTLNGWPAFGAALGTMYLVKGTVRGYQERSASHPNTSSSVESPENIHAIS